MDLKNQVTYQLGCGYSLDSQTKLHLYYESVSSLVSGISDSKSIFLGGNYQLQPAVDIGCDVGIGLTEGSPKISVSLGAGVKF